MTKLDRDGVAIHYEVEGQGLPLLLSHGYGATGRMWKPQVQALKDRCRIITWYESSFVFPIVSESLARVDTRTTLVLICARLPTRSPVAD